jgi:hypothetical protein
MAGTKRVINIGTNADDGTGDLLRAAFEKVNQNFDDVWTYGAVNSNLNITADTIAGTTDVIVDPADSGAFKVAGDTIINPDNGNYNFTVNTDLANDVLYVKGSSGFVGIKNNAPTVPLDVTGDAKVSGTATLTTLSVTGNTTLGDSNTDTVNYVAKSSSDFLPVSTTQNLGGASNRWGNVFSTNLDVSGSISGTFTGNMTSTLTGDVNNTNVTSVNLNVTGPSNVQNLTVTGDLVVQGTTTTLETNDVLVNNQITFEGTTADAHETILTVTEPTQDNTITFKNATGTVAFLTDVPSGINDLSDVDTSTTPPTNGQALVWNNANLEWEPGTVGGGSEVNDLTAAVTWANIPDANVPASAVTQHQAALSVTESQISDLGTYLTSVPAQSFASLTGKPTTIAGYGITDGGIANVVEDTTPQLGGNLDAQAFDITTTGKILYSNVYNAEGDLPSASTYHGMFAHVHGTGAGYFAHGGNWVKLANATDYAPGIEVSDESADTTCFPMFGTGATGSLTVKTDQSRYTYDASTGTLSATAFIGDGSGLTNVETITLATLKSTVAASSDFADFQSRIAAL